MSDSEEETYSTMFASLRHPARRKILRMLAEKPKTFSEILEELGVSSSHLTYHLETLGELVSKIGEGKYRLSAFGEAAVLTMRGVEEVPAIQPKQVSALPLRWKSFLAVLMIGIIVLASVSSMEFISLNRKSSEYDQLMNDFSRVSAENVRLATYSISTNGFVSFLQDVIQLNISKYAARLESHTIDHPPEKGGIIEEESKYTLTSDESELNVNLVYRNQTLSRYRMDVVEFAPLYSEPQPTNILDMAAGLLQRYQNYADAPYLKQMSDLLKTVTEFEDLQKIQGNMKLAISTENNIEIQWIYTTNGIDYQSKGLSFIFEKGVLKSLIDGWFLFSVGSTEVNISRESAINIAKIYAEDFSWRTASGLLVKDFTILENPVSVSLLPHDREEPLALIPYWYVILQLDKFYPGNINRIAVGLWADTGEVVDISELSG